MVSSGAQNTCFTKMHGLGNDFVVLDARARPLTLSDATVRAIADRRTGVGCDQLIVIRTPQNGEPADARMEIRNADGGEVEACGNATRCVADLLMTESNRSEVAIQTAAGRLIASRTPGGVTVDMGPMRTEWDDIPLAGPADTLHLELAVGSLADPVAGNIGNPHATFFVEDTDAIDLSRFGPELEHHPIFPQRANIGVASVIGPDRLRLRVWERGVGITRACGTGACAALAAAARRGLTGRKGEVILDGGPLQIEWLENGHMLMTGPVAVSFTGELSPSLLS